MLSSRRMIPMLPMMFSLGIASTACQPPPDEFTVSAESTTLPVTLQTINGKFIVAENGGAGIVNANRDVAAAWESFQLVDNNGGSLDSGDLVFLRAGNGNFFSAENGGGGIVNANRAQPFDWETFRIGRVAGGGTV